jgi:preprotein translocase subunit SecF
MIKKIQSIPPVAWIIVAVGVLLITAALAFRILTASNVSVGKDGIDIENLTTASDKTIAAPENVKAVEEALAAQPAPVQKVKLQEIQKRQRVVQQQQQQQQQR